MEHTRRQNILLVDGDSSFVLNQVQVIQGFGYTVRTASTGEEALAITCAEDPPDLVLLEIHLGGEMSGAQAAAEILRRTRVPILFLSASTERETLEQVQDIPHYGYVTKASGSYVLQSMIRMALERFAAQRLTEQNEMKYRTVADFTFDWEYWIDPEGKIIYCSPSCEQISGYPREAFQENSDLLIAIVHPAQREEIAWHHNSEIMTPTYLPQAFTYQIITRTGELRWIDHKCQPVYTPDGVYLGRRTSNRDVTAQIQDKLRLTESEGNLREAERMAHLGHFEVDIPNNRSTWAEEVYRIFDMDPQKTRLTTDTFEKHFHPEDNEAVNRIARECIRDHQPFDVEYRILTNKGELRHIHNLAFIDYDPDGKPLRMFGILQDITQIKKAEIEAQRLLSEKEVLLREIHHRIKNNLYTITTLLSMQAGEMSDPSAASALQEARGRILSMMAIYDRLYRSADFHQINLNPYLSALFTDITTTWGGLIRSVTIDAELEDIVVESNLAFPLGIILNELLTNTCKYAFPDQRAGLITVRLHRSGERTLAFYIADNGLGIPPEVDLEHPTTFGLNLVHILIDQIQGKLVINRESGTSYQITVGY